MSKAEQRKLGVTSKHSTEALQVNKAEKIQKATANEGNVTLAGMIILKKNHARGRLIPGSRTEDGRQTALARMSDSFGSTLQKNQKNGAGARPNVTRLDCVSE